MGISVFRMDQKQRERLPSIFTQIGLPEPSVIQQEGVVRYSFKLGFLRRLTIQVFEVVRTSGVTYDLWIPLTRSGTELFEALEQRGYSRVPRGKVEKTAADQP